MLVDSHCHVGMLNLDAYDGSVSKAIEAAMNSDISYILCPSTTIEDSITNINIVSKEQNLFAAIGVHPTEVIEKEPNLEELLFLGNHNKVIGIGEVGLDFYRLNSESERKKQISRFKLHIRVAKELKKPLIIHARNAEADIIQILRQEKAEEVGGVIHCFTGNQEFALKMIDFGFYVSFSGIITFPKARELQEIAKNIPLSKILIETDAPFLAPVPMRGKPNEPKYLKHIAQFMANLRGISYNMIAKSSTDNFFKIFK